MTDDFSGTDTLRHRLLVAGTNEIGQYGIANFSLRRVAAACGTSCAAPYRHFKNKEAFILEILRYIEGQWELLCSQILSLYEGDIRKQLIEVCIAYIRFWVANPNYRIASIPWLLGNRGKARLSKRRSTYLSARTVGSAAKRMRRNKNSARSRRFYTG